MRVAYLIQCHKDPAQVSRLVDTLLRIDPDCFVHVSHDRNGPELGLGGRNRVHVSRDTGGRGRFENVDRWLDAARWLRDHQTVDYVLNISGQDYPVASAETIHRELEASGDGMLEFFPVLSGASNWGYREGDTRYNFGWHDGPALSPRLKKRLRPLQAVNRIQPWVRVNVAYDSLRWGVRHHRVPTDLTLYGGSFFVNLSWRCVEHILSTMDERPEVDAWARGSLLIEEGFFQTLLLSAGTFNLSNSSRRFYDFSGYGMGSPAFLGREGLDRALASDAFFARKFELAGEAGLFDHADEALAAR